LRAPPLRERAEDIPLLCHAFMEQTCSENGIKPKSIMPEAVEILTGYHWPGNVRELRNVIERLVILSEESIGVGDLPEEIVADVSRQSRPAPAADAAVDLPREARDLPLRELRDLVERQYIQAKLNENGWNISRTAVALGIERTNLHKKMRTLGLHRDESAGGASGPGRNG
jgi:DNA-binding NtrC family response regulator